MQGQNSTNISCSKFKIKIPMRELPAGKNSPKYLQDPNENAFSK